MVGRATRSKQKQTGDDLKTSASSTRSTSRLTASPTIPSLNLRSSSPMSLRSASPSGSVKSVDRSPGRARGRGRGRGASRGGRKVTPKTAATLEEPAEASSDKQSSSEDEDDKPLATTVVAPKRGRGRSSTRGRGRGRGGRGQRLNQKQAVEAEEEDAKSESDSDSQPLAEIVHKVDEGETPSDTEQAVVDDDKTPIGDKDESPTSDTEKEPKVLDDPENQEDHHQTEGLPETPVSADTIQTSSTSVSAQVESTSDAAVIAELANRLAADDTEDWSESVDKVLLSDEHMQQLESVLTSDEGLKLLSEQQVFSESLPVESALADGSLGDSLMAEEPQANSNDEEESSKPSPTRRKSERVTDIERRTLAEKIRQENIKKEKELLEKLKAEKAKEASEDKSQAEQATPSEVKKPAKSPAAVAAGRGKKTPAAASTTAAPKSSKSIKAAAVSRTKSDSQATPAKDDNQIEERKTPEGGWVPGKVKVIDRSAEKNKEEKDKARRKSLETKRTLSSAMDDLFKPDSPVHPNTRKERAKKTLRDDEVSGGEDSEHSDEAIQEQDDDSDDEWVDDDPDRLWCVCRKPHDNRFMICCDRCEEWYHGDCVGITRKRGQQMEIDNEEYICSQCKEKELIEKLGGVEKLTEMEEEEKKRKSAADLSSSAADKSKSDGSQSSEKPTRVQGEIRKKDPSATKKEKKRFSSFHPKPPRQHCIGPSCDNWAEDGKIFCSLNCIMKHAKESLRIITKEKNRTMGAAESAKSAPDIVVMERHTGRLVTGAHAPNEANLVAWLTKHPSFEVLRPGQQTGHVSSNKFYGKSQSKLLSSDEKSQLRRQSSSKDDSSSSSSKKPSSSAGPDSGTIRSSVRKALQEALLERIKELEEEEEKSSKEEVKSIVSSIEHELHKYYGDTNSKYKARYRSLVFNIKDSKNKGLFRKILKKKLKPAKLVRMTPDELASKELHQWREKELKSELEKIKKDEELRAKMAQTPLRKITHKGEVVVEEETYEDLDTKLSEEVKDYDMDVVKTEPGRDISSLAETPGVSIGHHVAPVPASVDVLSSIMGDADTTSQHDAHLFDANCKICTGKQAAPTNAELERQSKRVRVSHVIHKSENMKKREKIEANREESSAAIDKVVKTELKDLEKEIKEYEKEDKMIAENLEKRRELQSLSSQDSASSLYSPKQEPSSTVQSPHSSIQTPPLPAASPPHTSRKKITPSVWKGFIDVPEVCKFFATAHPVHGSADCLKADLPDCLQIVGRIHPSQVWDYLEQLKLTVSREVLIIRFSPANDEEKIGYKEYFKYLSEKKRFGVVGNGASVIKDMYILPLPSQESLPSALKPYRHKVLTMDNRPHMLLGLIVRSKQKRQSSDDQSHSKKSKRTISNDDEPYEPPGFNDEPGTPPLPDTKASKPNKSPLLPNEVEVEEYDPLQPDVSLAKGTVDEIERMDTDSGEPYDPIVSAYSLADDSTLNAEDAPGAAPYSPSQEDEPMEDDDDDEAYDPTQPLETESKPSTDNPLDTEIKSPTTLAQEQLKAIEEQLEKQRKQLELQTAQLTLPKSISDIMSGKTIPTSQPEPQPYNMMDYLKRTLASNQQKQADTLAQSSSSEDRAKISFPIGGKPGGVTSHSAIPEEEHKPPQRLYVPASSVSEQAPLPPPPAPHPDMYRSPPSHSRQYDSAPPPPADPRGVRNPPGFDYDNRGHNDRQSMARNWRADYNYDDPRARHRSDSYHHDRRDWDRFPPRGRGGPPRQPRGRRPYY